MSATIDECARNAANAGHDAKRLRRLRPQRRRIVAEHLDDDLPVNLRNALENVVADRLRDRGVESGNAADRFFDLRRQLLASETARPLGWRFQIDEKLGHVDGLRVGPIFGPACLGDHLRHLGELANNAPHLRAEPRGLGHGYARRQHQVHPERPLVELGQELRAQPRNERHRDNERSDGTGEDHCRPGQRAVQHAAIHTPANIDKTVLLAWHAAAEEVKAQQRHQRD